MHEMKAAESRRERKLIQSHRFAEPLPKIIFCTLDGMLRVRGVKAGRRPLGVSKKKT
jgi:hypothetical protein